MEKIRANLILEILGRPPEHVKEALATLVDKLISEKGVSAINKQIHDPIPVEGSGSLFTSFAEIELEFDTIEIYFGIIFSYMPSHIEITLPERFTLSNTQLNDLGGILIQRLHSYESIAKRIMSEREIIFAELKRSAPEVFKKFVSPTHDHSEQTLPQNKTPAKKQATKKKSG